MPESGIATLTSVAGLDVTLSEGVLSVTIDRPDSLNSVTTPVLAGIADAMEQAVTDRGSRWDRSMRMPRPKTPSTQRR
jgi:enoyl-CoA hydratase